MVEYFWHPRRTDTFTYDICISYLYFYFIIHTLLQGNTSTLHPFWHLVLAVFPQWERLWDRLWWCHLQAVWLAGWPGADDVQSWQHHLWHHFCGFLQKWPFAIGWLRWFQLQRLGYFERRACRYVYINNEPLKQTNWIKMYECVYIYIFFFIFFLQVC